jgi:tRNA A-37 threonylcarbamoyl transferase component Bud32
MQSLPPTTAAPTDCPDRETLQSFVRGRLAAGAVEGLAQHLATCRRCDAALPALLDEDTLLAALRTSPARLDRLGHPPEDSTTKAVRDLLADPAPAPPGPAAGSIVGPYRLLERLGAGAMGVVFKAVDTRLNRVLAVKFLRCGPLAGPELLHRFRVEAAAVARLEHAHIVRLYEYDFGEANGGPFFSMEYVDGGTLAKKLAAGPLPQREAAELLGRLARAVHYAHERGVIHRDIKPANVLLAADGTPKLSDFGLAKLADAADGCTQTVEVLGTRAYMSPEQARGEARTVTAAADVYSLGAVLYQALTGVPPFQGARDRVREAILAEPPVAPRRRRPELSAELEAICLKCLEKEPRRRYPSANDLADDLDNWLAQRRTKARPPRWPAKVGRILGRHKAACAAVLLVAAVLGTVCFGIWRTDPERPRREAKAALARQLPAGFLGSERLPGPFRWVRGGDRQFEANRESCVTFFARSISLLEFVDDPMCSHYRVEADLRHDDTAGQGDVGLFVGFRRHSVNGEARSYFYSMSFAVHGQLTSRGPNQPSQGVLHLHIWYGTDADESPRLKLRGMHSFALIPGPPRWHHVAVEVSPKGIKTYWRDDDGNEQLVDDVPADELTTFPATLLRAQPLLAETPPGFAARGGVGIFARRSTVSFKNFTVTPLP